MRISLKTILVIIILIVVAFSFVSYLGRRSTTPVATDYKGIEYVIEGARVKLTDGTRYFGNELRTDLNGDGREDVVFLITQNLGGTGTFFYVVAALNTEQGYVGSDGYLLGDRIAPQTTEVSQNPRHKYVIVVNYADRAPSEPMTADPSIGKSAYLKLDPVSMRWGIVEPNFEGESR
jgi:hypothetical protein